MRLNLACPCTRTCKAVAREGAWGQGVVYVLNYANIKG